MTMILETDRLTLRELRPDDLDELAAMGEDEEQMRFYPGVRTRAETVAWLDRHLAMYPAHGYGFWLIEVDGAFAGYCGIRPIELDGVAQTEIGWHIHKRFWNQGVATEAASAVQQLAHDRFGVPAPIALINPDHHASRRVAEKIGLQATRTTTFEGDPYVVYVRKRPASR